MHLPAPIVDLGLILIVAGAVTILFRALKQPLVLGYLVAGILVGPQVRLFPTVTEREHLSTWAELGVIFLLFLLGLEFSFKKLFRVGRMAVITATVEAVAMVGVGYGLGLIMGWNSVDSLFLGAVLSISSTTIIIKALDELGLKTQQFATVVVGILVIEDLIAILILGVLSTFGVTKSFEGTALLLQMAKLAGFLAVIVPVGLWLIPRALRVLRKQLNDETRVVGSIGVCLGCVLLCTYYGFSPALGAFLTGAFFAETAEGERLERILKPVRDLFGAIFFTTVGMLVDLNVILKEWQPILLIAFAAVVGKVATSFLGMRLAKADRALALQTGLSLAQIGEFSFIIVTLGLTLKVIRPDLYPLTVAVSVITTFATPYLIKLGVRLGGMKVKHRSAAKTRLWDGHVVELEVHPHYSNAGSTLEDLKLREKFGVTIVSIYRGEHNILSPTRKEMLMPFDRLMVFGDDLQLLRLSRHLQSERRDMTADESPFGLERVIVQQHSSIAGKSILQIGIRDKMDGVVLGVRREQDRQINPESKLVIEPGDELWIYGNLEKIRRYRAI